MHPANVAECNFIVAGEFVVADAADFDLCRMRRNMDVGFRYQALAKI